MGQHTWSPSQTMVKKKEAPVADAARAGTGNTNRSPSLASQTIENQHTNHQPLAARRLKNKTPTDRSKSMSTGTRSTSRSNKALVAGRSAKRLKKPLLGGH